MSRPRAAPAQTNAAREQWQERATVEIGVQRVPQRPNVGRQQRELQPEHAAIE
jgi:hypothetical protein